VIATGVVEGAARYVVGERLDNSGMRWIEDRAEAVLGDRNEIEYPSSPADRILALFSSFPCL
jgi:hypothetical protein